ncbi:MAG: hypothetical protein JSS78_08140 [Bacteroidetes bacterium]|nr:hypothetical protein [Bacteroidota bacterium]
MQRTKITLWFTLALLSINLQSFAQQRPDSSLPPTTIEVIQTYQPKVKQTPKPEFKPDLPPHDTSRPNFKYDIPQQTLYYTYSSLPLRPLALGKDSSALPFVNYAMIGAGTQSSIFFDAGIAQFQNKNYNSTIHLHHLSQEGSIKNQKSSLSGLEVEGKLHTKGNEWSAGLDIVRNRFHYYGYDHNLYDYSALQSQITYTGVNAFVGAQNNLPNKFGLDYKAMIGFTIYNNDQGISEQGITFDLPVSKTIDSSFSAGIGIRGQYIHQSQSQSVFNNYILQLTPNIAFRSAGFKAKLGVNPTLGMISNSYLLPDLSLSYIPAKTNVLIGLGWQAHLQANTLRALSNQNPYLIPNFDVQQTRIDEIFASLESKVGNHFSFGGKFSWLQFNNLPLFLNDTLDQKQFYLLYDSHITAIALQLTARYQIARTISIGLSGTFTNYTQSSFAYVWHQPGVRLRGDFHWKPLPKLDIAAYLNVMGGIYARNLAHQTVKLPAIFDFGFSGEYQFIPRLSAFIQVNNLFNNQYQRWYNYPVYGTNLIGGLRLKF